MKGSVLFQEDKDVRIKMPLHQNSLSLAMQCTFALEANLAKGPSEQTATGSHWNVSPLCVSIQWRGMHVIIMAGPVPENGSTNVPLDEQTYAVHNLRGLLCWQLIPFIRFWKARNLEQISERVKRLRKRKQRSPTAPNCWPLLQY